MVDAGKSFLAMTCYPVLMPSNNWQTVVMGRIGAMIVISIIPVFILFLSLRDFFIKGLSEGTLKG